MTQTTPQTALIYAMVTASAVDGDMADAELGTIGRLVETLPAFEGFSSDDVVPTSQACAALLQGPGGLEDVLDIIVSALPETLRETAYALAVDIAAADLAVVPEEMRYLQLLRQRLGVDRLVATAIERAARARYRRQ